MEPLETGRLMIRPFVMADLKVVHATIWSDPAVAGSYSTGTKALEETREWLNHHIWRVAWGDPGSCAVVRKDDGKLIGLVALSMFVADFIRFEEDPTPKFNSLEMELGYAFGSSYWGRGYATEACRALTDYAFTGLRLRRLPARPG